MWYEEPSCSDGPMYDTCCSLACSSSQSQWMDESVVLIKQTNSQIDRQGNQTIYLTWTRH
jgi:hypothetical protein